MFVDVFFFYLFSTILIVSALCVVFLRNTIYAVLSMIGAFFNAAGLFILLGAEFLAFVLAIVYIGAIAILFLFVVMLLNIKDSSNIKLTFKNLFIGIASGIFLLTEMITFFMIPRATVVITANPMDSNVPNIYGLATLLYGTHSFIFIVTGFILLVAMIGALVLAHSANENDTKRQNMFKQTLRNHNDTIHKVNVALKEGLKRE